MTTSCRDRFRFGDFELDVGAYELRRGGRSIRLEQQPMDLLILLVERRHQLVSRAEIVERLWGADTFVAAETGINTAIRKIRHALHDSARAPTFVERVPGKGYRFIAEVQVDPFTSESAEERLPQEQPANHRVDSRDARRSVRFFIWVTATSLLVTGAVAALIVKTVATTPARLQVLPLTRLAGTEREPAFSPDGSQVAFAWDSERENNFDIYVTLVDGSGLRRLTSDSAADLAPQWSPDSRCIAYVRVQPPGKRHQLRVMSALGASDRAVSDFPAWHKPSWSPNGRYLAVGRAVLPEEAPARRGIYLVPVDGGDARALTHPSSGSHYAPAFSHDGRRLAYASCRDTIFNFDCHVEVLTLDEELQPVGTPRRLTPEAHRRINGIAWSRDNTFVLYGAGGPVSGLWRVSANGIGAPERVEAAGEGARYPASTGSTDRVVFSRMLFPNDVYRFEPGRGARPVAQSTGLDAQAEYSPDGRRLAFCSDRSGVVEVWLAAADGSSPEQLTRGPGQEQCSPAWSPEGRRIAFDSVGDDGFWQIWTISVDGGSPQQVTKDPADHNVPRWSGDGQWMYMSSNRGGTRNIWRVHVETGRSERVTESGSGFWSSDSPDHAGILYTASNADSPLLLQSAAGGEPQTIIPCVAAGSTVSRGPKGIYYLPCLREGFASDQPVRVFDTATRENQALGYFEGYYRRPDFYTPSFRKISMSPDGQGILYSRRLPAIGDLMLIENFR